MENRRQSVLCESQKARRKRIDAPLPLSCWPRIPRAEGLQKRRCPSREGWGRPREGLPSSGEKIVRGDFLVAAKVVQSAGGGTGASPAGGGAPGPPACRPCLPNPPCLTV